MDSALLQRVGGFSAVCLITGVERRCLGNVKDLLTSVRCIADDAVGLDLCAARSSFDALLNRHLISGRCTSSVLGDAVPTAHLPHGDSATICSKLQVSFDTSSGLPDTSKSKPAVGIHMSMLVTVSYCMTYLRNEITQLARKGEVSDE